MTITVDIRPEVRAELASRAAVHGRAVEAYVASLLEAAVHLPTGAGKLSQDRLENTLRDDAVLTQRPRRLPTRPSRASVSIGIATDTGRLSRARSLDRPKAAHAMNAAAGGRGGRAEPDARKRGAVEQARRAEEALAEIHGAAGDVAAYQVGVE